MTALVLAFLLVLAFWIPIFQRWQRGVYLLLGYMPFAGVVTLLLYPSPWPTLFKDIFSVIPAYLSFFLLRQQNNSSVRIPEVIVVTVMVLASVVFIQMFNPGVANWMVAAIGVKVWLFYLPLIFLASAIIKSQEDLIRIFRLMTVIAWVPCLVGIAQWMGSLTFGYEATIQAFYGDAAAQATQNFASFDVGSFFRIPATFVFVTQYFGYTLAMITSAYALAAMDSSQAWRRFSLVTLGLVVFASFLSGARAAYVFVPILLTLSYIIDGRGKGLIQMVVVAPVFLLLALYAGNIDFIALYEMMTGLFVHYLEEIAYGGLAIQITPLGNGTGMNTGPARYAFEDPESFIAIESYYAKAAYELGLPGLVVVVTLFVTLLVYGHRSRRRLHDKGLRSCSAAILAFIITIMLNNFKGWQIDLDPINVYLWLFTGFLLKLDRLTPDSRKQGAQSATVPGARLASLA